MKNSNSTSSRCFESKGGSDRRWDSHIKQGRQSRVYTCRRRRSVVLYSSWGGEQTPRRESDVIQTDVTLCTSAHFALKHDLKVPGVAQRDLSLLPVVALISCQVQEEMRMSFALPEHAEGPDAVSRHVEIKVHLDKGRKWKCADVNDAFQNSYLQKYSIITVFEATYLQKNTVPQSKCWLILITGILHVTDYYIDILCLLWHSDTAFFYIMFLTFPFS